jgi:SsrA-binding protein
MEKKSGFQAIINKKALADFQVLETVVVGVVLTGPETKSIRLGQARLRDSYVLLDDRGAYAHNIQVSPYKFARNEEYEPTRPRKLLLRKAEAERLRGQTAQKGVSVVPLKIFLGGRHFKLELGVVRGKKQYEKREQIKRRDLRREIEREVKTRLKI